MITFTTPASVSGVAQEGQLLTALGQVDDSMATITYQWQENISGTWTDIPGATSQTYTVIEANEGNILRVVETATDLSEVPPSETSTSAPTAAVTDITLGFTSGASIDNNAPRVGETLSAVNGSLNDTDASVTSYQWQRSINGNWTDIPGATSQTYTVVADDRANQLRVIETATDTDGGPLVTSTSDPTAAVPNPPPPAGTSAFLITGRQNPDSSTTFSIYDLGNNSVLAGPYLLGEAPPQVNVKATSYLNGNTLAAMFTIDDGSGTLTLAYTPIVDNNADNPPTQLGAIGEPWRFEAINARGSEMVWRNASSADLEGYSISNRQIVGADHMGAIGLEWQTVTMGRFGSAPDGLIMQSQSTGVLEVYDIQNNTITGASQLGTVGTDWKFSGLGNFNGDGTTDLLLRNDQTGGLQIYDIKDDKIVGTAFLGTIGTDWTYARVGPIADDLSQNLLLRNTSGDLVSYTIKNNAIVEAVVAGHTDPAQTMVVGLVQAMSSSLVENGSSGSMTVAQQPEQQQTILSQPHA
jgi:hypothetical protein